MSDRKKPRSLSEIVNDVLRAVRDYYDSEYVYYIEKEYGDIETIFEWCAENVPWQRDKIKMLPGAGSGRPAGQVRRRRCPGSGCRYVRLLWRNP